MDGAVVVVGKEEEKDERPRQLQLPSRSNGDCGSKILSCVGWKSSQTSSGFDEVCGWVKPFQGTGGARRSANHSAKFQVLVAIHSGQCVGRAIAEERSTVSFK